MNIKIAFILSVFLFFKNECVIAQEQTFNNKKVTVVLSEKSVFDKGDNDIACYLTYNGLIDCAIQVGNEFLTIIVTPVHSCFCRVGKKGFYEEALEFLAFTEKRGKKRKGIPGKGSLDLWVRTPKSFKPEEKDDNSTISLIDDFCYIVKPYECSPMGNIFSSISIGYVKAPLIEIDKEMKKTRCFIENLNGAYSAVAASLNGKALRKYRGLNIIIPVMLARDVSRMRMSVDSMVDCVFLHSYSNPQPITFFIPLVDHIGMVDLEKYKYLKERLIDSGFYEVYK